MNNVYIIHTIYGYMKMTCFVYKKHRSIENQFTRVTFNIDLVFYPFKENPTTRITRAVTKCDLIPSALTKTYFEHRRTHGQTNGRTG